MAARSLIAALALALCLVLLVPARAGADGDPASDVLLGQNVFYPYQPQVSPSLQHILNRETAAAKRQRFALKVALIGSPVDLGVIPDLFGQPQKYADFLDQEISWRTKQPLLVVMAAGYGVQGMSVPVIEAARALPKPQGRSPDDLARAAIHAVAKLAAASGHPIQGVAGVPSVAPSGGGSSGGSTGLIVAILAAAAALTAAALLLLRRRARSGPGARPTPPA